MHSPLEDQLALDGSDQDISAGLGSETDNPALLSLIRNEIQALGLMTFARFMDLALYHPFEGYYSGSRERIGKAGDYLTSPEVSSLFGYAIGRQLSEIWEALSRPSPFIITEFGAGTGRLAQDILRWTAHRAPFFHSQIVYRIVERSRFLRERITAAPGDSFNGARIEVVDPEQAGGDADTCGCVLANELIDSFPVHKVVARNGRLREIYVAEHEGGLHEVEEELSSPSLNTYFERLGIFPSEGSVAEVNLCAAQWLRDASRRIQSGYFLLFDYGYLAERLYAPWRHRGTLLCFHRHEANEKPLERIGRQDITAHVDFTSLAAAAGEVGLKHLGQTDQAHFLTRLGVGGAVQSPQEENHNLVEYYARRHAVAALLDSSGLGRIGVLLFGKNVSATTLSGFKPES